MGTSLTLFQVFDIRVRVHWSFLLILVYGAVSFAGAGASVISGAIYGIFVILLLFVCVTLHEFGHALAAQYYGIKVPTITLLPIGGVASLERMPDKPRQELAIAIAGPLVNVVLALGLLPVTLIAAGIEMRAGGMAPEIGAFMGNVRTPGVANLLGYLMTVNIMLALFNLLPAFPMDGGRILRALLAMALPYVRATYIAVMVGRLMAVLFAVVGIFSGNLFMLLIAFFVYVGGNGEMENVRARRALSNVPVQRALAPAAGRLYTSEQLSRAADLVSNSRQTDYPVMDLANKFAGVLTRERLIYGLREAGPHGRVIEYMLPAAQIPTCSIREELMDVWDRMATSGSQVVAVLDEAGDFVGIITASDLGDVVRSVNDGLAGAAAYHAAGESTSRPMPAAPPANPPATDHAVTNPAEGSTVREDR